MDELNAVLKARQFIKDVGIDSVPVDISRLAAAANASIQINKDLNDDESGQVFPLNGKNIIIVNGNHREERQRFTALHEIAHLVLDLPSQHHSAIDMFSYRRRPKEEILCDVFAAECLLPHELFKKDLKDIDLSLDIIKNLAKQYKASLSSTGSRFAVNCDIPCAFILMEHGKIRYVSSSRYLRELNGWIEIGSPIPEGSVAHRLLSNSMSKTEEYDEINTDIWFTNGVRNYEIVAEESILMKEWEQCLSLIWVYEELRSLGHRYQSLRR